MGPGGSPTRPDSHLSADWAGPSSQQGLRAEDHVPGAGRVRRPRRLGLSVGRVLYSVARASETESEERVLLLAGKAKPDPPPKKIGANTSIFKTIHRGSL